MKRWVTVGCLLLTALLILGGALLFDDRAVVWVTLCGTVLSVVPFAVSFEKGDPSAVRTVLLSVMVALSVLGRGAFAAVPFCKPVAAVTVLCGMYLGTEAGVLCGALSALLSAMMFEMGPWVPFQMLAWGLCGLLGGLTARWTWLFRLLLVPVGIVCGVLFSAVMDVWTVISIDNGFRLTRYAAALTASLPMTVTYAVSNAVFLLVLCVPFRRAMDRLHTKYGL